MVLLYYLSQNPSFAESVQPLMSKIKDSEQMLHFLNNLSKFSEAFGGFTGGNTGQKSEEVKMPKEEKRGKEDCDDKPDDNATENEDKKSPQSPTKGIADEFIQNILDSYLKKR